MSFPFVKGHGTGNDFVVLPDLDGSVHGDLEPALVSALCDRRRGIGGDGVLRVVRGRADDGAEWVMDYRNADGSVSQMCGNGLRVFARYLCEAGLVQAGAASEPLAIGTADGVKQVRFCDDGEISVDMGPASVGGSTVLSVNGRAYDAVSVDVGNPHAVAFVDDLTELGDLGVSPYFCGVEFPEGVNVEFVERRGQATLAMRVYERGVGETQSCGTGACAVVAAAADRGLLGGAAGPSTYTVRVRGGDLTVTIAGDGNLHLKGPAVLVAEGSWHG